MSYKYGFNYMFVLVNYQKNTYTKELLFVLWNNLDIQLFMKYILKLIWFFIVFKCI